MFPYFSRACLLAAACSFALSLVAQSPLVAVHHADRVGPQPERSSLTRLKGHVPAWASAANDTGAVADDTSLHLTFILARDAESEAAFTQLLADQQDTASARFHQWLTPGEIGDLYGPTQHDIDAFTAWLTGQGLAVSDVSPSRTFVTASASAGVAANALSPPASIPSRSTAQPVSHRPPSLPCPPLSPLS